MEEANIGPEGQEKIREGESTIKSIQILFNDFKKYNSDCTNWDEFKRSEREFNELVDVFNQIVNPNQNKQYDNMSDDSERDEELGFYNNDIRCDRQDIMYEQSNIGHAKVLDMDEVVKDRAERIDNINHNAVAINSMATEINQSIYSSDNIVDQIVKCTRESNNNLLKANKELTEADYRAANRKSFCMRLVVILAMIMLVMGFFVTRGYYIFSLF